MLANKLGIMIKNKKNDRGAGVSFYLWVFLQARYAQKNITLHGSSLIS